ncbi:Expanded protein [Gryllus bimaculatus]|nr:Expanded protein [Gryllus bimaculatus]
MFGDGSHENGVKEIRLGTACCRDVDSMRNCTVSAPVPSCSTPLTSSSKKYAAVELLTRQRLYFVVEQQAALRLCACVFAGELESFLRSTVAASAGEVSVFELQLSKHRSVNVVGPPITDMLSPD